jgi:hypothetical protein
MNQADILKLAEINLDSESESVIKLLQEKLK